MLSALDREHVNIISDDDDFEIQEINSKDSPKLSRPQTQTPLSAASTSTCRPTDLSTRSVKGFFVVNVFESQSGADKISFGESIVPRASFMLHPSGLDSDFFGVLEHLKI